MIVVGAGIVGCTVAHELAKSGASVQVLETRTPSAITLAISLDACDTAFAAMALVGGQTVKDEACEICVVAEEAAQ